MRQSQVFILVLGVSLSSCNVFKSAPIVDSLDEAGQQSSIAAFNKDYGNQNNVAIPRYPLEVNVSGACPAPSPHYEVSGNKCFPSCGVVLSGRYGEMHSGSCKAGFVYAGISWEQLKYSSLCCVKVGGNSPPAPIPVPSPSPTPIPPPTSTSCRPQPKPDGAYTCGAAPTRYYSQVQSAIDEAIKRAPQLLDLNDEPYPGSYKVIEPANRFFNEVVQVLIERGFCAYYDGEELGIKKDDSSNEQHDIHRADGYLRRGAGSYVGLCTPAWF